MLVLTFSDSCILLPLAAIVTDFGDFESMRGEKVQVTAMTEGSRTVEIDE